MNYSKLELEAILDFVRTAKVFNKEGTSFYIPEVRFNYDDGNEVKWITKEDLVFKLRSKIKELSNDKR